MIVYAFQCPVCGQAVQVRRSSALPAPITCSMSCRSVQRKGARSPTQKYTFSPAMDTAVLQAARGQVGSLKRLWRTDPRFEHAGIPYPIVRRQAWILGAIRSAPDHPWTAEESAFCERLYLQGRPADSLARTMRTHGWRRSAGGIVRHMSVLGITRRQGDFLTPQAVAQGLGIDAHVVGRWITRHGLPVHHRSEGTGHHAYLRPEAVRTWILGHVGLVAKVAAPNLIWLIGLLCPQSWHEPEAGAGAGDNGEWMNGAAVQDRAWGEEEP